MAVSDAFLSPFDPTDAAVLADCTADERRFRVASALVRQPLAVFGVHDLDAKRRRGIELVRSVAKDRQRGRAYELDPRPRLEPITHQHYVRDFAEPVHERIACGRACSRIHRAAAKAELPRSAASRDCQVAKTFLVLTTRSTRTRLYFLLQLGSLMHLRHLLSSYGHKILGLGL